MAHRLGKASHSRWPVATHLDLARALLDEDLLAVDPIWAVAGSPHHVFQTSASELMGITGARASFVRAE
jgi:hypothetical protein